MAPTSGWQMMVSPETLYVPAFATNWR